jgi:hypothetical protein
MPARRRAIRLFAGLVAALAAALHAVPAFALDVRVKQVQVNAGAVTVTLELRDTVPDRFKPSLDGGGALHLRLQAELWESRSVFDRLVYPAIVQVLRLTRGRAAGSMAVANSADGETTYASLPNPLAVDVVVGRADRLARDVRYYVHVIATLGSLPEREVDDVGDAVFGRPSEANGLGAFGRMLFRKVVEISDYLQSETVEAKSKPARIAFP